MIDLLNGMNAESDVNMVTEKMTKFIEIGQMLGYDMQECSDTRDQLIQRMGELEVVK